MLPLHAHLLLKQESPQDFRDQVVSWTVHHNYLHSTSGHYQKRKTNSLLSWLNNGKPSSKCRPTDAHVGCCPQNKRGKMLEGLAVSTGLILSPEWAFYTSSLPSQDSCSIEKRVKGEAPTKIMFQQNSESLENEGENCQKEPGACYAQMHHLF